MDSKNRPAVALIYDFDGTLSPRNMQEYSFMDALGYQNPEDFWKQAVELSKTTDTSSILCYMKTMLDESRRKNIPIRRESFISYGKTVELYEGVKDWFRLINAYGEKTGLDIRHYINSSGLKEMIEGTAIAGEFEKIYACTFIYDEKGTAVWPGIAVDYTNKTQFIHKINKGITEVWDNSRINSYVKEEERPIPFKRMIYFGDGATDIPSMKIVKLNGGYSIAVYSPDNEDRKKTAEKLILDDRVNFVCPADYRSNRDIYKVVTTILEKMKRDYDFDLLQKMHRENAEKNIPER